MFSILTAGELLGVEYLYDQTGRALQLVPEKHQTAEMEDVTMVMMMTTKVMMIQRTKDLTRPWTWMIQQSLLHSSSLNSGQTASLADHPHNTVGIRYVHVYTKKKRFAAKYYFFFPSDNDAFYAPFSPNTSSSLSLSPPRASIAELRMPSRQSGKCIFFTAHFLQQDWPAVDNYCVLGEHITLFKWMVWPASSPWPSGQSIAGEIGVLFFFSSHVSVDLNMILVSFLQHLFSKFFLAV